MNRLKYVLPWAVAGAGCWISYSLSRHRRRLLKRIDLLEQQLAQTNPAPTSGTENSGALDIGSPAPDFELRDIAGERRSLFQWRGKRVLLIFFDPECVFCAEMAPSLASLSVDGSEGRPVTVIVSVGSTEKNRQLIAEHGLKCPVLLQEQLEIMLKYGVAGTPTGYLVDENGLIASEQLIGAQAILQQAGAVMDDVSAPESGKEEELAGSADHKIPSKAHRGNRSLAESRIARQGLAKGEVAPPFNLPRLGGGELSLDEYKGQMVLLVFSDPECGPCNQLAPRLEKLSRRTPDIQVIMVSRGSPEANSKKALEHGLTFPVLLQRHWEISRLYAMFATPIAYLIDEEGLVASHVAAGIEPILNLLIGAAVMSLLKQTKDSSDALVEARPETGESFLTQ